MLKKFVSRTALLAIILCFFCGCADALKRGWIGSTYISTARPDISVEVIGLPLMACGEGSANLFWTGMMGGLDVQMWLAVYGEGGLAPLAITAQAATPQGWHWDSIFPVPGSVDQGVEIFNGASFQAYTFIVNPEDDPFGELVTGVKLDGQPQLWMVRAFQARYNFNDDKIIMEYREPLPEGIVSLSALPLGQSELLEGFAQRARDAFRLGAAPKDPQNVKDGYIEGVQWRYMGQRFLGSASPDVRFNGSD